MSKQLLQTREKQAKRQKTQNSKKQNNFVSRICCKYWFVELSSCCYRL